MSEDNKPHSGSRSNKTRAARDVSGEPKGRKTSSRSGGTKGKNARGSAANNRATKSRGAKSKEATRLSTRMDKKTRLRLFMESSILDFVLVLAVSVALTFTISYGFYSAGNLRGNVALLVLLTVPLLIALFIGSWSKKALVPSIVITVILAAIIMAGAVTLSTEAIFVSADDPSSQGILNDVEGNYVIFAFIVVAVPIVSYLLSRRTVGLVFLLIMSIIACGAIQFLYREWIVDEPGLVSSAVVFAGIAMMFVYQTYKQSVYAAKRVKRTSFSGAFLFSALVTAMSMLIGVALFYGVVDTFNLQTPEIKPFEHYVARPVDENAGTSDDMSIDGDDTTSETNEDEETTQQDSPQSVGEGIVNATSEFLQNTAVGQSIQEALGYSSDSSSDEDQRAVTYLFLKLLGIIIAVLLVLLFITVIVLWYTQRKRRLKKAAKLGSAYEVWFVYTFLMGRLRRLKIRKPDHITPLEFAAGFDSALAPFSRNTGGVTFLEVTGLYMDVCYGGMPVAREDLERMEAFYFAFFKNAREYVGWPKWILWKFWRI